MHLHKIESFSPFIIRYQVMYNTNIKVFISGLAVENFTKTQKLLLKVKWHNRKNIQEGINHYTNDHFSIIINAHAKMKGWIENR